MPRDNSVAYDAKSFIIGGRRVFLSSGSVHYFRSPHECWKDIIQKAMLAGLNTIETYVAWNFHEYDEGTYRFDGDRNLGAFLNTIHELGLFAIVRPGPYICAEWDFGGFPWWLATKEGIRFRTDDPVYLSYVDRWFDELIPIIAEHQFTRGGSVIAVQVENEFSIAGHDPDMGERYQGHLRDGMRARGIDVPLLTCAGGCSGTIECANAHRPSELFAELRKRQPDMPLFSTEFWCAWYDVWGGEHRTRAAREVYNETLRIAANGGSGYNYYMYHGGTNFGYTSMCMQTTSYDSDAPLSEAGQWTEKGYLTKLAAHFLQAVAPILTEADGPTELDQPLPEGVKSWVRRAGDSAVIFFENTTSDPVTFGFDWQSVAVPESTLQPGEVRAVTLGLRFSSDLILTYSTAMILQVIEQDGRPFVLVYGAPGSRDYLEITDGGRSKRVSLDFDKPRPVIHETQLATVVELNEQLARKTWLPFGNQTVMIGPEHPKGMHEEGGHMWLLAHGALKHVPLPAEPRPEELPELGDWGCAPGSPEVAADFDDSGWLFIDEPKSMLHLGNGSEAYGWYRTEIVADEPTRTTISFQECADILTLFVNGERVGSSPPPPEQRKPPWGAEFEISLRPGRNVIAVLADNLGLAKGHWQIGKPHEQEAKGIFAPVTLADGSEVRGWKYIGRLNGERLGWTETATDALWSPTRGSGSEWMLTWWKTTFELPDTRSKPVFLDMSGMRKGVIWLNGRNLGRYWDIGPQRYYYVPTPWLMDENTLVILDEHGASPDSICLVYDESALPFR